MRRIIEISAFGVAAALALGLSLAIAFAAPAAMAQQGQQKETPLFTKAGYWIKVDAEKTTADSITLQVGTKAADRRAWQAWKRGDALDFDVPKDLQVGPELYLQATANPAGKAVRLCVYYQNMGVKELEFNGDKDSQIKQTDRENDCR